jgi:hypothetical protein
MRSPIFTFESRPKCSPRECDQNEPRTGALEKAISSELQMIGLWQATASEVEG